RGQRHGCEARSLGLPCQESLIRLVAVRVPEERQAPAVGLDLGPAEVRRASDVEAEAQVGIGVAPQVEACRKADERLAGIDRGVQSEGSRLRWESIAHDLARARPGQFTAVECGVGEGESMDPSLLRSIGRELNWMISSGLTSNGTMVASASSAAPNP